MRTVKRHSKASKYSKPSAFKPIALAIAIAFTGTIPNVSKSATFTVTNTNDLGVGTLRRAIFEASINPGPDNIIFDASLARSTINLNSELTVGDFFNSEVLTITGPLAARPNGLIINAGNNSRIFKAQGTNNTNTELILENLTLTGGNLVNNVGGAINAKKTNLTLNDSVITGNTTVGTDSKGGGLYLKEGTLYFNESVLSSNSCLQSNCRGGGLYTSEGNINIFNSLVSSNINDGGFQTRGGGADINSAESLIIANSVFSHNFTNYKGSAVFVDNASLEITFNNSIFSNNKGDSAIYLGSPPYPTEIRGSTISENQYSFNPMLSTGLQIKYGLFGVLIEGSTITNQNVGVSHTGFSGGNVVPQTLMKNSILSGNTNNLLLTGIVFLSSQSSLFGDPASEISGTGNYFTNDPKLGPLQSNGGSRTKNHLPEIDSLAVDLGNNTLVSANYDQRGEGFPRIQNTTVDMGSIERQQVAESGENEVIKRGEMADAILNRWLGSNNTIGPTGLEYHDVQARDLFAARIEQFKNLLYTEGCAANKYCANSIVTREEMAKIILTVLEVDISPSNNTYDDVPPGSFNFAEITTLRDQPFLTQGCDTKKFCPKEAVTRKWFQTLLDEL